MKNTQKGFMVPLLILIVAILAIGGGTYSYLNSKNAETSDSLTIDAAPSVVTHDEVDKAVSPSVPSKSVGTTTVTAKTNVKATASSNTSEISSIEWKNNPATLLEYPANWTVQTGSDYSVIFLPPQNYKQSDNDKIVVHGSQITDCSQISGYTKCQSVYLRNHSQIISTESNNPYVTAMFDLIVKAQVLAFKDGGIQLTIGNFRETAEVYYSLHNNSYIGLCSDQEIVKQLGYLKDVSPNQMKCLAKDQSYAITAKLNLNGYACLAFGDSAKVVTNAVYKSVFNKDPLSCN